MKKYIKINDRDNVLVALNELRRGEILFFNDKEVQIKENIQMGHKIAITTIMKGENIVKYGYPIGHAVKLIKPGEHVHVHNTKTNLQGIDEYEYSKKVFENSKKNINGFFKGYKRKNGSSGVRNELWIIPTVGCVNGTAERIVNKFKEEVKVEGIDYVGTFKHNHGCSQMGADLKATTDMLRNMVKHPNAGGILVLGLGCEYIQMEDFMISLGDYDERRVKFLVTQEVSDEISESVELLKELY